MASLRCPSAPVDERLPATKSMLSPMPPTPEEREAIKRRERALDAQPWVRAQVEKGLAERRAKRARQVAPLPKAPALHGTNGRRSALPT